MLILKPMQLQGVGIKPDDIQYTIYDCLTENVDPNLAILSTSTPNLDVLPSSIDLVGAK